MSSLPILPLFLQKDCLSNLNNQLFDKTGCFAFLCTDTVLCASNPKSWQDAFSIIVPGLYSVYHDYACLFLFIILDKNNSSGFQPSGLQMPTSVWPHINTIIKTLRPNIVHGILHPLQREIFQNKISNYYLKRYYQARKTLPRKPGRWPSLIEAMDEEQWQYVVSTIINDADDLYDYLCTWSKEWEKNQSEIPALKKRFAMDARFKGSFNDRVCRPIVIACLDEANKDKKLADIYLNVDTKNPTASTMNKWQDEMVKLFLNGTKPDALYTELEKTIRNEIIPNCNQSSASIAQNFGII